MNFDHAVSITKELIIDLENMSLDEENLYVKAYYLINHNKEMFFDFSTLEEDSMIGNYKFLRISELLYYLKEQLRELQINDI